MRRFALLAAALLLIAGCNAPGVGSDGSGQPTPSESPATIESPTPTEPPTANGSATANASPTANGSPTANASPTASESPTATPPRSPDALADGYEIGVEGGELPFDARLVFARTALLLDRPGAEPPATVELQSESELRRQLPPNDFFQTLQVASPESAVFPAYVETDRRVVLSETLAERPTFAEATFAQEAAHVVQLQTDADSRVRDAVVVARPTAENNYLVRSVIEGAAVYTEAAYQRQYLGANRTRIDTLRAAYRNASGIARLSYGLYYFGARYVSQRADSPADTWAIYENPPRTTEELLHGLDPGSEPERELDTTDDVDGWTERNTLRTTMGELFTRTVLASNLSDASAARAAEGWGTDRRLVFTDSPGDQSPGYVWVHRWDTASDADEFDAALARYLNRTANRTAEDRWTADDRSYQLVRVAPETTALLMGDPAFVRNATVSGSNESITVGDATNERVASGSVGVTGSAAVPSVVTEPTADERTAARSTT